MTGGSIHLLWSPLHLGAVQAGLRIWSHLNRFCWSLLFLLSCLSSGSLYLFAEFLLTSQIRADWGCSDHVRRHIATSATNLWLQNCNRHGPGDADQGPALRCAANTHKTASTRQSVSHVARSARWLGGTLIASAAEVNTLRKEQPAKLDASVSEMQRRHVKKLLGEEDGLCHDDVSHPNLAPTSFWKALTKTTD